MSLTHFDRRTLFHLRSSTC